VLLNTFDTSASQVAFLDRVGHLQVRSIGALMPQSVVFIDRRSNIEDIGHAEIGAHVDPLRKEMRRSLLLAFSISSPPVIVGGTATTAASEKI
jgi:hypothetical protein